MTTTRDLPTRWFVGIAPFTRGNVTAYSDSHSFEAARTAAVAAHGRDRVRAEIGTGSVTDVARGMRFDARGAREVPKVELPEGAEQVAS